MKAKTIALAALLMTSAALLLGIPVKGGTPVAKSKTCLYLSQQASLKNNFDIWVTPTEIRINNLTNNYSILSHAPDWNVIIWRTDKQEMATVSHHDWCQKYNIRKLSWTADLDKPISSTKSTKNGYPCTLYKFGKTSVTAPFLRTSIGTNESKDDNNHAEILVCDYPGAEKTGPVIGRIQSLPPLSGLPIMATRFRGNGTTEGALYTWKAEPAPLNETLFNAPKGYQSVPFTPSWLSERESTHVNDFMQDYFNK